MEQTQEEKRAYLLKWMWTEEDHPDGFKIYSHNRFQGKKYKIDRAYEVMKENEPSLEPVITARIDNPEEMAKMKDFLRQIVNTPAPTPPHDPLSTTPSESESAFIRKLLKIDR